ncbi:MAG: 4Fe-4S dicluster domain-containing protein [Acidimicrobiia bacterium]
MPAKVVSFEQFPSLIEVLRTSGYVVVGPTLGEEAIVNDEIESIEDLPIGWTDRQDAGSYELARRNDEAVFGYAVGPRTWKKYLFPPQLTLLTIDRTDGELRFEATPHDPPRYAFLGVRPCELAAIGIQDRVFLESGFTDPAYAASRGRAFTIAVNCAVAGGTCFCVSMGTGPRTTAGYDLVLTEVLERNKHEFIIESGSEAGETILSGLPGRPATDSDSIAVAAIVAKTATQMGRSMETSDVYDLLTSNLDHPIWEDIAQRCLSCANCTLVCPTCFCSTVEDVTDLKGTAVRQRRWDSCFTMEFTNLHQYPVRSSTSSRYRQWMTHKLAYWHDQFDTSGCVGCGRCITWCPAGIDITAEVAALRANTEVATV